MKPHEKTYLVHPQDNRCVVEPGMMDGVPELLVVADLRVPIGEAPEVAALFSAAPDMARVMLALGSFSHRIKTTWHTEDCWEIDMECGEQCKAIQTALRKAGVLP